MGHGVLKMSTATQLFELDDATFVDDYGRRRFWRVEDLSAIEAARALPTSRLPAADVMARLGERLASDADLQAEKIVCRVVTDKNDLAQLASWE